jgi:dihydrofolate reductase
MSTKTSTKQKVFVHMGISVDGYVAGPNRGPKNPLGDRGSTLHEWLWKQRAFCAHLGVGHGDETGPDNDWVARTFDRIGANIMGKRMFDEGEAAWPENAPFHNSVFVLTHEKREPWKRPGGTTFYFVNEPLERVLAMAREAAGTKDVRISGGRDVVIQYLNAGLVDELVLDVAPKLMGEGLRLFEKIDREKVKLEIAEAIHSPAVTHVRYGVSAR